MEFLNTLTSETLFKCEVREYSGSTKTVLKRHMSTKQKQKSLTPEKERSSIVEESVKLVSQSPKGQRVNPIPNFEHIEPVYDIFTPAMNHKLVEE